METKDLIIEAAFIAFIDHGYGRVSLNQIIKTTGLTKGAFYHYFSSKDELIKEVMQTYFFKHLKKTMAVVSIEGQSFDESMDLVLKNVMNIEVRLVSQPERIIQRDDFLKLFWESMSLNDVMKEMSEIYQHNIVKVMAGVIDKGKADGVIRLDADSVEIANVLTALVRGTIMTTNHMSKEASEKILSDNLTAVIRLIKI